MPIGPDWSRCRGERYTRPRQTTGVSLLVSNLLFIYYLNTNPGSDMGYSFCNCVRASVVRVCALQLSQDFESQKNKDGETVDTHAITLLIESTKEERISRIKNTGFIHLNPVSVRIHSIL